MPSFSHIFSSCCRPGAEAEDPIPLASVPVAPTAAGPSDAMGRVIVNTAHIESATPGLAYFHDVVGRNLPAGQRAIDLGSGGGRDSKVLAQAGWQVTAVDPRREAATAVSDQARIDFVLGTLADVAAQPGSIQLINCQRVTQLMSLVQLRDMLDRAASMLSPDGHLSISFFGPDHSWTKDPQHRTDSFYDVGAIETELQRCDLQMAATPDEYKGPHKAGNGQQVQCWHEIRIVARKEPQIRQSALATQLRAQVDAAQPPASLTTTG